MSWWERELKRFFVNGTRGVDETPLDNVIEANSVVTVEALGPLVVTYAGEVVTSDGAPVYIQTR